MAVIINNTTTAEIKFCKNGSIRHDELLSISVIKKIIPNDASIQIEEKQTKYKIQWSNNGKKDTVIIDKKLKGVLNTFLKKPL